MPKIKEFFQKNKKTIIILSVIVFVGIFLRTYKFHDWLRFSEDQARDATIISSALEGRSPLPLLGPNAGSTKFLLGPMYYYFSYISARMFGDNPTAMAYPSLFFSILAIPLLFLFLNEYFDQKISLALTAIMSVSYFLVISSRFSSNPNLMPPFILACLYSLLKILNNRGKNNLFWSVLIGISLGIGIQLHTTFFVIMPIVTLGVFAYLLIKKNPDLWKNLIVIVAISLVLNTSQFVSEIHTNWHNTRNFLAGFHSKSDSQKSLADNILAMSVCQTEANTYIISPIGNDITCADVFTAPTSGETNKYIFYFEIVIGILFSVIGYFLLWREWKKAKEPKKKNFLGLILTLNLVTFIIFVPITKIMSLGYFMVIFLVPFVLLGLLIEFIKRRYDKIGGKIVAAVIALLIIFSLARDGMTAISYARGLENNSQNSTLGEIEKMSPYILSTSNSASFLYFSGENSLAKRFYDPLKYFAKESGATTELRLDITARLKKDVPLYYIKDNNSEEIIPGQMILGHEIISGRKFSNQTILILKN